MNTPVATIMIIVSMSLFGRPLPQSVVFRYPMEIDDVVEAAGTLTTKYSPLYIDLKYRRASVLSIHVRGRRHQVLMRVFTGNREYFDVLRSVKDVIPGTKFNVLIRRIPGYLEIYYKRKRVQTLRWNKTVDAAVLRGTYSSGSIRKGNWQEYTCLSRIPCGHTRRVVDVPREACKKDKEIERIIGGIPADAGSHPWQAAIRRRYPADDEHEHTCGGVILDTCLVLSAAHCFLRNNHRALIVRVGDYYNRNDRDKYFRRYESSQDIAIRRIERHEKFWSSPSTRFDIALIFLKRAANGKCIEFGNFVQPICLPINETQFGSETKCVITGWGATEHRQETKDYPSCLRQADVFLKSQEECMAYYPPKADGRARILDSMICAVGYGPERADACQGDSGGPLVCQEAINGRHTVWAITSWGEGCGSTAGVYTRVANFTSWIKMKALEICDYYPLG